MKLYKADLGIAIDRAPAQAAFPCGPHIIGTWAPVGLATGPQLGRQTGPLQILSLGFIQSPFGLAQNGPRMGPNWAPSWFRMGSVWANS